MFEDKKILIREARVFAKTHNSALI